MAEQRDEQQKDEGLRHKTDGRGTHGEPTRKDVATEQPTSRDLPEGNGATGEPAAFPDHP